jgi:hypothetical protein
MDGDAGLPQMKLLSPSPLSSGSLVNRSISVFSCTLISQEHSNRSVKIYIDYLSLGDFRPLLRLFGDFGHRWQTVWLLWREVLLSDWRRWSICNSALGHLPLQSAIRYQRPNMLDRQRTHLICSTCSIRFASHTRNS